MTTDSALHLAGPCVRVENRVIQRCLVCGEKLCDLAVPPGLLCEAKDLFGTWKPGAYVRFSTLHEGTKISEAIEIPASMEMPEDWCLSLVEM